MKKITEFLVKILYTIGLMATLFIGYQIAHGSPVQLPVSQGGTGRGTTTPNAIILSTSSPSALSLLYPGTNGQALIASSSAPLGWDFATIGSGTLTSVNVTVPTGLSVSGVPITTNGTAAITLQAGYNIPLTASTTEWATALLTKLSTSTTAVPGFEAPWTGLATLGVGKWADNGTVVGFNATSSTVGVNIQGTAGTNDILDVASSSAQNILKVLANNGVQLPQNASSTNSSTSVASTLPVLQLGSTALSSPVANGTYFGINTPSTFTGDFLNFQKNGTVEAELTNAGILYYGAGQVAYTSGNGYQLTGPANTFNLTSGTSLYNNSVGYMLTYSGTHKYDSESSGAMGTMLINGTFQAQSNSTSTNTFTLTGLNVAPTFGTGASYEYDALTPMIGTDIAPVINVNTHSTGTYAALYIAPVETSLGSGTTNYVIKAGTSTNTSMFVLTNQGNVGIGTTTPNQALAVIGTIQQSAVKSCDDSTHQLGADANGNIVCDTALSDERLKTNITTLNNEQSLLDINNIRFVQFDFKNQANGKGLQFGVIAQEVQKVFPNLVTKESTGFYSMNYQGLFVQLGSALQDLSGKVNAILARLDGQDAKIKDLQDQNIKQAAENSKLQQQLNFQQTELVDLQKSMTALEKGK